jgi:hypothetical protein
VGCFEVCKVDVFLEWWPGGTCVSACSSPETSASFGPSRYGVRYMEELRRTEETSASFDPSRYGMRYIQELRRAGAL